jgi:hypothetical protein
MIDKNLVRLMLNVIVVVLTTIIIKVSALGLSNTDDDLTINILLYVFFVLGFLVVTIGVFSLIYRRRRSLQNV